MNTHHTIYYLGPEGSYSHLLVQSLFNIESSTVPLDSFQDVIDQVENDDQAIGVLAIENSISSSVHQTVDLLYNQKVSIVAEASMSIAMNLLSVRKVSIEEITDVYSHPQALAQCAQYIKKHKWTVHPMKSTAAAVQFIKNEKDVSKVAIGSSWIAHKEKLHVLESDISDAKNNMTRWVFVATPGTKSLGKKINKLTYIFKVKHEPGSLVAALSEIAKHKGNLTKIESRPLPGTHWEYGFWIDVEIPEGTFESFDTMMRRATLESRLIGAYEKGSLLQLQVLCRF